MEHMQQRKIAFRAWVPNFGRFFYTEVRAGYAALWHQNMGAPEIEVPNFDEATLQQSTGLTDKNGKEIWEGDILHFDHGEKYEKKNGWPEERRFGNTEVEWRTDSWGCFMPWNKDKEVIGSYNLSSLTAKAEVIGNIYENEDLLE